MFTQLDHIGIATRNIDDTLAFYTSVLGGQVEDRYTSDVPGVEVHVAVVKTNGVTIELLEPTNPASPISRFIRQKGKGVHHVAYRVENLDAAIEEAKANGIRFLEETLRTNARGRRLIYINPISTQGTLVELCEYENHS